MQFKRNESFRYTFGQPLPALFSIIRFNGREINSSPGEAEIIDISPEGIRLSSELSIPDISSNEVVLSIEFILNENEFIVDGKIVWQKKWNTSTIYGINLIVEEPQKNEIIEQLKIFSKQQQVEEE